MSVWGLPFGNFGLPWIGRGEPEEEERPRAESAVSVGRPEGLVPKIKNDFITVEDELAGEKQASRSFPADLPSRKEKVDKEFPEKEAQAKLNFLPSIDERVVPADPKPRFCPEPLSESNLVGPETAFPGGWDPNFLPPFPPPTPPGIGFWGGPWPPSPYNMPFLEVPRKGGGKEPADKVYESLDNTDENTAVEEHLSKRDRNQAYVKTCLEQAAGWRSLVAQLKQEQSRRNPRTTPKSQPAMLPKPKRGSTEASWCWNNQSFGDSFGPSTFSKDEPAKVQLPSEVNVNFGSLTQVGCGDEATPRKLAAESLDDDARRRFSVEESTRAGSFASSATASIGSSNSSVRPLPASPTGSQGGRILDAGLLGPGHDDAPDLLGSTTIPTVPQGGRPAPPPGDPPPPPSAQEYSFTVSSGKFKGTDRSIVSNQFGIVLDGKPVPFLVQITASKVEDKKGGHNFKKAKGFGKLELNCKRPPASGERLCISFKVGSLPERGPVSHNFAESSLCCLSGDEDMDFTSSEASHVKITVKIPGYEVLQEIKEDAS